MKITIPLHLNKSVSVDIVKVSSNFQYLKLATELTNFSSITRKLAYKLRVY